jgi:adenylate cyclase
MAVAVAGTRDRRTDHVEAMVAMSLELKERLAKVNRQGRHARDFRIGIDSARVFAGVIGKKKFSYDLWDDSMNTGCQIDKALWRSSTACRSDCTSSGPL